MEAPPPYLVDTGDDLQAHRAHQGSNVIQEAPREAKLAGCVQLLAQKQVQRHAFHLGVGQEGGGWVLRGCGWRQPARKEQRLGGCEWWLEVG